MERLARLRGLRERAALGVRALSILSQGIQNVAISYTAGYTTFVPAEDQTVPASPGPYTVEVDEAATFYLDQGVTLASDGTPLTPVTGAPGPLQYTPPLFGQTPPGVYTFNAGQQAADVNISYLYGAPPEDLSEAAARLVAQMYKKRSWIGQNSQIQPGIGTTAYSSLEVEIGTAMTIERYKIGCCHEHERFQRYAERREISLRRIETLAATRDSVSLGRLDSHSALVLGRRALELDLGSQGRR